MRSEPGCEWTIVVEADTTAWSITSASLPVCPAGRAASMCCLCFTIPNCCAHSNTILLHGPASFGLAAADRIGGFLGS